MFLRTMRGKLHTFRTYAAATAGLVRLAWQTSPAFLLLAVSFTLLLGLLPAANIVLTSALLQTLVEAAQAPTAGFPSRLLLLVGLLAATHVLTQVAQQANTVIHELYRTRVTNAVQLRISAKAATIDLAYFEDPAFHNQMQTAVNEAAFRVPMFIDRLLIAVSTLTSFGSLTAIVLFWQPWIVPVLLGSSLATLWIATHFASARVRVLAERAETERKKHYLSTLLGSDHAAKEIRLFGLGDWLLANLRQVLDRTYHQDRRLALRELGYNGVAALLLGAVQPALIAFTAWQTVQGLITVGQFSLYSQSIIQLEAGWSQLMFIQSGLHENTLFAMQLFQFLALESRVEAPREHRAATPNMHQHAPRIEFRQVSFVYPGSEQPVLDEISFTIEPGEAIALVGENGAGKTTLIKLLAGLYEPTSGAITFNGVDLRALDRVELRSYLSVIFQDFTIYHLSLRENIGVGQVQQIEQDERIEAAARRSGLEHLIPTLPHGYQTVLGRYWDQGHELSGGQRQLVALTRALVRDAPVLILDEPSAALDVHAEQRFFRHLLEERTEQAARTIMFISHRFTTVRRAQRIFVLMDGRISEQGTHDELMALEGHYAEMFKLQAAPYTAAPDAPSSALEIDAAKG